MMLQETPYYNLGFILEKEFKSAKELNLSIINANFKITNDAFFIDEKGKPASCLTRKFYSLEQIENYLDKINSDNVYLYKLYELTKYDMSGKPTGEKYYHLRCCVRS